jgi:hypothetical protein
MKAQPLLPAALKRRRGPRVAVLALVLCSLLVPLAFLFDRAPSGTYRTLPRSLPPNARARITARVPAGRSGAPASSSLQRLLVRPATARPCWLLSGLASVGLLPDWCLCLCACARCRVRDDGGAAPTGTPLFPTLSPARSSP